MRIGMSLGLAAVLAMGAAASARAETVNPVEGRWQGVVVQNGVRHALSVELAESDNTWDGRVSTIDYAATLSSVSVDGNKVHFVAPDGTFDGEASGDTMTGSVSGTASGSFSFKKTEPDWNPYPNGP